MPPRFTFGFRETFETIGLMIGPIRTPAMAMCMMLHNAHPCGGLLLPLTELLTNVKRQNARRLPANAIKRQ
jgi:hypothetical protein